MSNNYGNHPQGQSFTNPDMNAYQGSSMTTVPLLEPTYAVDPDQAFQLGTTMQSTTESTQNTIEYQSNFSQDAPERSSGHYEDESTKGQFPCRDCDKSFSAQYLLTSVFLANRLQTRALLTIYRKHEHVHTKPLECHLCVDRPFGAAERKDLNRHFWVWHREYARENGIPSDHVECPECGEETRSDNLKRHMTRKHRGRSST
jgi:hypothetical protein